MECPPPLMWPGPAMTECQCWWLFSPLLGGMRNGRGRAEMLVLKENVDPHKSDHISCGPETPSGLLWGRWEIGGSGLLKTCLEVAIAPTKWIF